MYVNRDETMTTVCGNLLYGWKDYVAHTEIITVIPVKGLMWIYQ